MPKLLDHTSDLYIEGRGRTLGDAIVDVARGMVIEKIHSLPNPSLINRLPKHSFCCIKNEEDDKDIFVITTLQKVLEYEETNYKTIADISLKSFDENPFRISLTIEYVDYPPSPLIKAVTYHALKLIRKEDEWIIRVLFDI